MEACAAHTTSDITDLATYAGFSRSTALKAVPSLETLGIVGRAPDGSYTAIAGGLGRGMTPEARAQAVRRSLLGFRPFEMLVEGIAFGEPEDEVIRKTLQLLGSGSDDVPKLHAILRWGEELDIFDRSDDGLKLAAELSPSKAEDLGIISTSDLESEAKARLFNARRLGQDANNYLDDVDRGLLADALLSYDSAPRTSIGASGQAIEDFLRHVADDAGYGAEAKKASGAGQLANLLYTKGVIHSHQHKLIEAIATIRNATAHRKDKKSLKPWDLTSPGAFSALSMALTAIRSIHLFIKKGQQTI
jgi:hypothetical protein